MPTVHFSIGKKGGIGKSQICIIAAQGLINAERKVAVIDLDPATSTITKFEGLEVIVFPDMIDRNSGEVDPARFDDLIELANDRDDLDDLIIDTGASNCITFFNYLDRNDTFELFEEEGFRPIIHAVVQGGDNQAETLKTLSEIQELFPDTEKFIWLNEYLNRLNFDGDDAIGFTKSKEFKEAKKSILAVFRLPYLLPNTEAPQINKMNENGILFSEVDSCGLFKIAEKKRLKKYSSIVIGQFTEAANSLLTATES